MKISGGTAKGRTIGVPEGLDTRPPLSRTRQMLFSILGEKVEGATVLDLFSGCGSLGLEALSHGAAQVVFVEKNIRAVETLRRNIETLEFTARTFLARHNALGIFNCKPVEEHAPYDLAFIDPPYPLLREPQGLRRFESLMHRLSLGALLCNDATVIFRHETRAVEPESLGGWEVLRVRPFGKAQWTILGKR
ncbi:MAG: 16S rRNA (guanine(966)-N(2))-methyltransferase RsmD [Planctomycetota bacterium]